MVEIIRLHYAIHPRKYIKHWLKPKTLEVCPDEEADVWSTACQKNDGEWTYLGDFSHRLEAEEHLYILEDELKKRFEQFA